MCHSFYNLIVILNFLLDSFVLILYLIENYRHHLYISVELGLDRLLRLQWLLLLIQPWLLTVWILLLMIGGL